jgi:hypothetical protein
LADARYLIDIILNARDNTSEAVRGATERLGLLRQEQERVAEQNRRTEQSFEQMSSKLRTSQAELLRQQQALGNATKETTDAQVRLEQASRSYVQTLNDQKSSEAQRVQGLQRLKKAEDDLALAVTRAKNAEAERADAESKAAARRIQQQTTEIERVRALRAFQAEAIREEARQQTERDRAAADSARKRAELLRMLDRTEEDIRRNQQRRREEELREIKKLEAERERTDRDRMRRQQELNRVLDRADADSANRRQQWRQDELREVQQLEAQRNRAARERLAQQERELGLTRQYIDRLQQLTRLERQRGQAERSGDILGVARLDFDARATREEATELAAELRALFDHIEANVDLDSGEAMEHAAALIAIKEALGSDVHFDVDADVGGAMASMAAVEAQSRRLNNELGFMRGLTRSVSEGFHQSSGTIASFDNFLRGLLSLGIAAFFNQLVLLASAAAGAMFSLASSAGMAGAALGGALVAGVAQALGPLGLLIAAAGRVASVMDAVQQANLLQQQQSYEGETAANRQANALDTVRGAEERLADAGRRTREAQRQVNEARQEGIDRLNELILAERGLSLTVEESEAAIRRAAQSGDTAALPRAFLRRDEAQRDLRDTREQIRERRAAGPEASPEIQQAREDLADANRAAKEAQRSLDGAKRSARDAEAQVTAAAGKLNFLLGQLSGAERRLYNAVLRLQDVWRQFSQNVTEPLINAFTFAIDRIIVLLQDARIITIFRNLSEGLAGQLRRVFSAFTNEETIGQILRIVSEAQRNLAPLATIAINIGRAFLNIAESAGPALRQIIRWVRDISNNVADFFEQGRKSGELQDFFREGVVHLKAWGDLIWEVIRLFAALAGPGGGARNGLTLVREMSDAIRGWADAISTPGTKLNEFFQRFFRLSRQMIEFMAPVLASIANEIDKTFNRDGVKSVQGFSFFLAQVLIPAIGDFARFLGQVTAQLRDFGEEHPNITRIATAVLSASLAFSVFGRALTILGPILGPIRFLAGQFANMIGLTGRLAAAGTRLGAAFAPLRAVLLGPWGAVAAILLILLQRAGKLDDIWRKIIETARELWREVQPGFADLQESVQELLDALGEGGGLLDVLTAIASVVGDVLLEAINSLGILLQNVGRGVLRVFGGLIDFVSALVNLLQGDFDEAGRLALRGIRRVASGILDALWGVLSGIGGFFIRLFRRGIEALINWNPIRRFRNIARDIIEAIVEGLAGLGSGMVRSFRGAVNAVSDFIHNLGGTLEDFGVRIVKAIAKGIASAPDVIVEELAKKVPGGKDVVSGLLGGLGGAVPGVGLLLNRKVGGPIPGDPSQGRLIVAHGGEHMMTAAEVAAAGGHGVIYALRRMLGGGGQGRGGSYQEGGAVGAGANIGVTFAGNLGEFIEAWGGMWDDAVASARRGVIRIQQAFQGLRQSTAQSMDRLYRSFRGSWADIEESGQTRSRRLANTIRNSMDDIAQSVYQGMRYVGRTTNESLRAFDAKTVQLSITAPRGRAVGGMVGMPGERGADLIPTLLGRGEAVLNWAHQKVVNSALWNTYGTTLDGLFGRTSALHAGTGGRGYAEGGYTGPGHSGEGFTPVWNMAKKTFGMTYFTGYDGHNRMTSSGNVSDHWYRRALDMGNGPSPTPGMDGLNAFFKTKLPQVVKQLIWRDKDQFQGFSVPGHMNHVHLAMLDKFAFSAATMAKLISRTMRGLSVAKLLAGVTDSEGFDVDHVDRIGVKGSGPFREMVQKIMNRVRRGANSFIDMMASQFGGGTDELGLHGVADLSDGPRAQQIFNFFRAAGFTNEQAAAWVGNFVQESGLDPSAVQPGGPGRGLAQWGDSRFVALQQFAAARGKPWQDFKTQLDFVLHELRGPESAALASIKGAKTLQEAVDAIGLQYERFGIAGDRYGPAQTAFEQFARRAGGGFVGSYDKGGELPGPLGRALPIIAHAGEWILNKAQQSKLAQIAGMSSDRLKNMLGFDGKPKSSFQDGGEVLHIGDSLGVGMQRALERLVKNLTSDARVGRNSDQAVEILREKLKKAYREVIFDVGTNDSQASTLGRNLKRAYKMLGDDQELILSTVRGPAAAAKNAVIREFARENENVRVVNANQIRAGADGIHLTSAGYQDRAKLFANTVNSQRASRAARDAYEFPLVAPQELEGIAREVQKVYRAINNISFKRSRFGKAIDTFTKNIRALTDQDGYLDQMLIAVEDLGDRLTRRLELAQVGFRRVGNRLRRRDVLADAVRVAEITVTNLERVGDALLASRERARRGLNETNRAIARLRQGGITEKEEERFNALIAARNKFRETLDEFDSKFLENRQALFEARVARFEARTEQLTRPVDQQVAAIDRGVQIAEAFGRRGAVAYGGELMVGALQNQQAIIGARLQDAIRLASRDARFQSLVDDLAAQYEDLNVSIQQQIVENFRAQIESFDAVFANRQRLEGLSARWLDLRERAGDRLGAASGRITLSNQRVGTLRSEESALRGLLGQAINLGDEETARQLTERIDELVVAIREEIATTRDLTLQYRQTATDIITGRQDRSTGLIGTAGGILETVARIAGATNLPQMIDIANKTAAVLVRSAGEIAQNVGQAINENLFSGQADSVLTQLRTAFRGGPEQFGSALARLGPTIAALEATMGDAERTTWQALIQSMIDNTTATLENNEKLDELTGQGNVQDWSTTLWQRFREAVFNGVGQILPQYSSALGIGLNGASMMTGPNNISYATTGAQGAYAPQLNITQVREKADPVEISSNLEYLRKLTR